MQFLEMIDALEDMVVDARRVPGTGKVMLDREELAQLLDQVRATAPAELREAEEIREQGEAIVNEAYVYAKKVRAKTEHERRQAVLETAIVEDARAKAAEIIQEAERQSEQIQQRTHGDAARLIKDSDVYALQSLERLATYLDTLMERFQELNEEAIELKNAIQNGLRLLGARTAATTGGRARTRRAPATGAANGNGNGHSNGNGKSADGDEASLNEDELVTLASSS